MYMMIFAQACNYNGIDGHPNVAVFPPTAPLAPGAFRLNTGIGHEFAPNDSSLSSDSPPWWGPTLLGLEDFFFPFLFAAPYFSGVGGVVDMYHPHCGLVPPNGNVPGPPGLPGPDGGTMPPPRGITMPPPFRLSTPTIPDGIFFDGFVCPSGAADTPGRYMFPDRRELDRLITDFMGLVRRRRCDSGVAGEF